MFMTCFTPDTLCISRPTSTRSSTSSKKSQLLLFYSAKIFLYSAVFFVIYCYFILHFVIRITKALLEAKDTLKFPEAFSPDEIKQKTKNITSSSRKRKMPPPEDEKTAKFIKLTGKL